jgi:putative sterol carrier protein
MDTFPSVEWVQTLANRLNALPGYQESGRGWRGRLVLVALKDGNKLPEDVAIGLDPTGGVIQDVKRVEDWKHGDAEYTLSARYSVWKDVIQAKYDILFGVMTGKIKVKGSVFKLMLQLKTPEIMLQQMRAMDTAFPDELSRAQGAEA